MLGPRGFAVFCDDVRDEISGKTTYIGVYSDALFIGGRLPQSLSKLCIIIHMFCKEEELFENLVLTVSMPWDEEEKPSVLAPLKRDQVSITNVSKGYEDQIYGGIHIAARMMTSPFEIKQYGRIRVSLTWDDKLIPAGSLLILPPPEREQGAEHTSAAAT